MKPASSPRVDILYSLVGESDPGRAYAVSTSCTRIRFAWRDPWTLRRFSTPLKHMSICMWLRPPPVGVSCTPVSSAGKGRPSSFLGGATAAKVHWSRPWYLPVRLTIRMNMQCWMSGDEHIRIRSRCPCVRTPEGWRLGIL
jgi:hypothetical protein